MIKKVWGASAKTFFTDIAYDFVGTILFAIGLQSFNSPQGIAPGGVSGVAVMFNYLWGWPVSTLSLLINVPLILLAFLFLGRHFTQKTLTTVLIMTLTLELVHQYVPEYIGDPVLAALYGGVLMGAGLGIVFMRGSTTGGVDIITRLIQRRYPHMRVGRIMLLLDAGVLLLSAVVYRSLDNALYGMISIFVSTRVLDGLLYGLDSGTMLTVISDHTQEISKRIVCELNRSSTILQATGAYTGKQKNMLICVVRKPQLYELKHIVYDIDPNAFMIATDAAEVLGEGFKETREAR